MKTKLIKFLNSVDFGIKIANDYYGGINRYYMADKKNFDKNKLDAVNTLQILGKITESEMMEACKNAFSARLEYLDGKFHYTAGQFYNIEVPQAVLAVAEYIQRKRKAIDDRLEYLRAEIIADVISYAEILELQSLVNSIKPDDVLLLQWAGKEETK